MGFSPRDDSPKCLAPGRWISKQSQRGITLQGAAGGVDAPLVPCTARLAVIAFLMLALFPVHAALVSWGLVALSLLVLVVAGIIVNKLAFKGEHTAFIMKLPLYHVPNARTIGLYVENNTVSFIKKAGTLILIASVVVWALSTLPGRSIEQSVLATFGRALEPIGALMGLG